MSQVARIDAMREVAEKHSGYCLSVCYRAPTTCWIGNAAEGTWAASAASILAGSWCP